MRLGKLPPDVIDRLDVIDRHAGALARAATLAEGVLARAREILNGKGPTTGDFKADRELYERTQAIFHSVTLPAAQAARARADAGQKVASSVKAFVDGLPDDAEVEAVEAKPNGVDLDGVRTRIAELRDKITRYKSMAPPADRALLEAFIDAVRAPAEAQVSALIRGWPHFATAEGLRMREADVDIALQTVMVSRDEMISFLCARIDAQANAASPPSERPARIAELESELVGLQKLEAMFVDRAIANGETDIAHDPSTPAPVILGVRVVDAANARGRMQLASLGVD